jgi:hypothetical protein
MVKNLVLIYRKNLNSLERPLISFKFPFRTERRPLYVGSIWPCYTGSLFAPISICFDDELNSFSIGKRTEAARLDCRLVDKYVFGAIVRDEKAEAFYGVKPNESKENCFDVNVRDW